MNITPYTHQESSNKKPTKYISNKLYTLLKSEREKRLKKGDVQITETIIICVWISLIEWRVEIKLNKQAGERDDIDSVKPSDSHKYER